MLQGNRVQVLLAAAALTMGPVSAALAASGGHGHEEHHEPVPTGAALVEQCEEYSERLSFTRAQLKERNIFGRWNLFRGEHRKMERFYDANCTGDVAHSPAAGHGAGDDAGHGAPEADHGDDHHG